MEAIFTKTFSISGADLKRQMAEEKAFKADRRDDLGRLCLMEHADGYVMVRRPNKFPFVMTEMQWSDLPPYDPASSEAKR